jgi:hypothetical protein
VAEPSLLQAEPGIAPALKRVCTAGDGGAAAKEDAGAGVIDTLQRSAGAHVRTGECVITGAVLAATHQGKEGKCMQLLSQREANDLQQTDVATDGKGAEGMINLAHANDTGGKSIAQKSAPEHYVESVAQVTAKWLAEHGHGEVQVQSQGLMVQLGSGATRARFTCLDETVQPSRQAEESSRRVSDARAETNKWTWEVTWGGSEEDAVAMAAFKDAVMPAPS